MTPLFHAHPVNDPFGDPVVYVDCLFARRALLFDLGDIQALPARKILRLSDVFVSHMHMDHFIGLDRLVRICLGRQRVINLHGPPGIIEQVEHKLAAYTWNLVEGYATDFNLRVTEYAADGPTRRARFRCHNRFRKEPEADGYATDGILVDEDNLRVRGATLDHRIPCLAFALEEKLHINVWKNRLDDLGLPTGPWLQTLKQAVRHGDRDDTPITIRWRDRRGIHVRVVPLGRLRNDVLNIVPGQKIAYVVDAVYHPQNARLITALARAADVLFIESAFLEEDARHAAEKFHLTARQAGELARTAGVKRVVAMHYSARYGGAGERLADELNTAFLH